MTPITLILNVAILFPSLRLFQESEATIHDSKSKSYYNFHDNHNFFRNWERQQEKSSEYWTKSNSVKTYWFNQTLDHFSPSDTRRWQQRYFTNDQYYKPGGPIFLLIGAEVEASPFWMSTGEWTEFAKELGAYCIQVEHRFYGKSHPTPNLSVANLKYLSSEQALADLAAFTTAMKNHVFPTNKWVAFGGSYGGNLAAWYRLKYPHLVDVSVASSAPVLARMNFKEYMGVITKVIRKTNSECVSAIKEAVDTIEYNLKTTRGQKEIEKTFNLCSKLSESNPKDISSFFQVLAYGFVEVVQSGSIRYYSGSDKRPTRITVETFCDIMTGKNSTSTSTPNATATTKNKENLDCSKNNTFMDRYAEVNALFRKAFCGSCCNDYKYMNLVNWLKETEWNSNKTNGYRQWIYQTCTEFSYFQTSDYDGQPFGKHHSVDYGVGHCTDIYQPKYDFDFIENSVNWTNANYGGQDIKVSRVIFLNGSNDPWHALGITEQNQTSSDNLVIFIEGSTHCADVLPSSQNDSDQLKEARAKTLQQIKVWLDV